MRWVKRIFVAFSTLLIVVAACGGYMWYRFGRAPDWYKPRFATTADVEQSFGTAFDKLATINNWADNPRVRDPAKYPETTARSVPAPQSKTVRLTEDELNALFVKWWTPQTTNPDADNFAVKVNKYLTDPQVRLEKNEVLLAGTVKELDRVVSMHLQPTESPAGLKIQLTSISGGKMPIPRWTIQSQIDRGTKALGANLPKWQSDAKIDGEGLGNEDAGNALGAKGMIELLQGAPIDPVAFLPTAGNLRVAARVTKIAVEDGELELTFEMLKPDERAALEKYIREPMKP